MSTGDVEERLVEEDAVSQVGSDSDDDTSSAAESFAAMARMTERYRRAAERYTAEDIANLNDFQDEDEYNTLERGVESPERQWHILKYIAKGAVEESRKQKSDYQVHAEKFKAKQESRAARAAPKTLERPNRSRPTSRSSR